MAGSFVSTGTYSNISRLQLEQLRKADFYAGLKALTVGDSALPPEGVVGPGDINAEPYLTGPSVLLDDVYSLTPPTQPGPSLTNITQVGEAFLPGTASLTVGLPNITLSVSQTIAPGSILIFPSVQPDIPYVVLSGSGTAYILTTNYSGILSGSSSMIQRGVSETVTWYGPILIAQGTSGLATASTTWTDNSANFTTYGVQAGDILLIKTNGSNPNVVGTVTGTTATTLSLSNITGGSLTVSFTAPTSYVVVRPNALQLFAVPGSGPTGNEQTFLAVLPGSTLHNKTAPTVNQINADRLKGLVPSQYALNSTVDRADSVYDSPAPRTTLNNLGYRVVLYPDNGSGTGPNLAAPITVLNPVIDPSIPSTDQRFTIDYKAGVIRFSCAPQLGGQIKVAGGVNGTTGRLNLYAVFWAVDQSKTNGSARFLYGQQSTTNASVPASLVQFNQSTGSWYVGQGIGSGSLPLAGADWSAMSAVQNWPFEVNWGLVDFDATGPSTGPYGIAWNDSVNTSANSRTWHFAAYNNDSATPAIVVYYGSGTGHALATLGSPFSVSLSGPSLAPSSIAATSDGSIWIGCFNSTHVFINVCPPGGGFSSSYSSAGTAISDFRLTGFGSNIVGAAGSTTSGDAFLYCNGFNTAVSGLVSSWILKTGPLYTIGIPYGVPVTRIFSSNALFWNNATITVAGLNSQNAIDLAYNAVQQVWLLVTKLGSQTFFWTTPDFNNWTLVQTLNSSLNIQALTCLKHVWVALDMNITTGASHVLYSYDAVSWYGTQVYVHSVLTSNNPRPTLVASDTMLASSAGVTVNTTNTINNIRFSQSTAFADLALT